MHRGFLGNGSVKSEKEIEISARVNRTIPEAIPMQFRCNFGKKYRYSLLIINYSLKKFAYVQFLLYLCMIIVNGPIINSMLAPDDILNQLRSGNYPSVCLLAGEEPYYIDLVSDYIEHQILDEAAQAFDLTVLYGRDLPGQDISPAVSAARGFAMMGGVKIVSPDKRLNLWKSFEKKGGVIMASEKLRDYKVTAWIRDYLQQRIRQEGLDLRFQDRVPDQLASYIGSDLSAIVSAVDKLLLGRPADCKVIDMNLVERNVGISKDFNVFELQDALVKGDVVKANRITQYFATGKDHPMIKELGILFSFFQNLMLYHYLPDKNERAVASALKISPYFVKDYATAARRYSAYKTLRIIGYFRDTDARLKGLNNPSAKDEDLWKELMYKILH